MAAVADGLSVFYMGRLDRGSYIENYNPRAADR